jgi:hypothetical protein
LRVGERHGDERASERERERERDEAKAKEAERKGERNVERFSWRAAVPCEQRERILSNYPRGNDLIDVREIV